MTLKSSLHSYKLLVLHKWKGKMPCLLYVCPYLAVKHGSETHRSLSIDFSGLWDRPVIAPLQWSYKVPSERLIVSILLWITVYTVKRLFMCTSWKEADPDCLCKRKQWVRHLSILILLASRLNRPDSLFENLCTVEIMQTLSWISWGEGINDIFPSLSI